MTRRKTWRCFFCNETFTNPAHAAEHFGVQEGVSDIPACKIKGHEGHLITYIRKLQAELRRYDEEQDHLTLAWLSMQAEHAEELKRAEDKGYGRGVQDMKAQGLCPEPGAHR